MYIPRHILGQFGAQLRFAGGRAPFLLALTALLVSCEGPSETGIAGPSLAVGTATRLVFTVEPNATTATAAIFPAVKVTALNASGNTATDFRGRVTIAIGTNPTGGVLQGTTAASADANGVATFSNLIISKAGTGYTLTASSHNLTPDTSVAFNVALPAKQLIFSVQPSTTSQGATISPAVQVTALDKNGGLAEGYRQNVTVAIGTNPGAGTLAGTTTVTFVHGVATFSDLSIDKVGSGYTLRATSLKLPAVTSAAFDIKAAGNFWTTQASMPGAREGLAAAASNDTLYAVGGYNSGSHLQYLATLQAYNPTTNMWTTKASMPTARRSLGAAAINGTLYAVGGFTNTATGYLDTLEAYNPATDTWTPKASMPTARTNLGVAAINGILYAVGGNNSTGYVDTLEAYDPATDTWTPKASMPTARCCLAVAAVNGILYAVGGHNSSTDAVDTLEAYDPATDTWTTKASMPTGRYNLGAVAVNGTLYAVGGYGGGTLATVEAYNPATNTWTPKASMPTARFSLAAAAINDTLYAVGGTSATFMYLDILEAYHP